MADLKVETGGDPTAFDAVAAKYDADFTQTLLGQLLRGRVWRLLASQFQPGQQILELACGTGADALWLAGRGLHVTATDGAAEMVAITAAKAQAMAPDEEISVRQLSLQELSRSGTNLWPDSFDGVFSNFGGLNTIDDWRPLARSLAALVRPGGRAVLVPMGPVCPWEIGWHLAHGQWRNGWRRFRAHTPARVGRSVIEVSYPSPSRLRRDFAPWFRHCYTESLGLFLPPSYLGHLVERWPSLFARLGRWEEAIARRTAGWGDHYVAVFERTGRKT